MSHGHTINFLLENHGFLKERSDFTTILETLDTKPTDTRFYGQWNAGPNLKISFWLVKKQVADIKVHIGRTDISNVKDGFFIFQSESLWNALIYWPELQKLEWFEQKGEDFFSLRNGKLYDPDFPGTVV